MSPGEMDACEVGRRQSRAADPAGKLALVLVLAQKIFEPGSEAVTATMSLLGLFFKSF